MVLEAKCCPATDGTRAAVCASRTQDGVTNPRHAVVSKHTIMIKRLHPESRWRPSVALDRGFDLWDVVAVLAAFKPALLRMGNYHVTIPTCEEGGGLVATSPGRAMH